MATAAEKIINLMKYQWGNGTVQDKNLASGLADFTRLNLNTTYGKNTALPNGWTVDSESDWEDVRNIAQQWAGSADATTAAYGNHILKSIPKSTQMQVAEAGEQAGSLFDLGLTGQKNTVNDIIANTQQASDKAADIANLQFQGTAEAWRQNQPLIQQQMDKTNEQLNQYQDYMTQNLQNQIAGQRAQQEFILGGEGIWGQIKTIADKQLNDSLADLQKIAAIARANIEQSRVALNEQEKADYEGVIEGIEDSVIASRKRTREDMNARGLFFSTVLDGVMATVERQGNKDLAQAMAQHKARLAKIASDMAIMSGEVDIETIKGSAQATAQYTATMLQYVAKDAETKQIAGATLAALNAQYGENGENVASIAAEKVFPTRMEALAPYEQANLEGQMGVNAAQANLPYAREVARQPYEQMTLEAKNRFAEIENMAPYEREVSVQNAEAAAAQTIAQNAKDEQELRLKWAQYGLDAATFNALYGKNGIKAQELAIDAAQLALDEMYQKGMLGVAQYNAETQRLKALADLNGASGGGSTTGMSQKDRLSLMDDYAKQIKNDFLSVDQKEILKTKYMSLVDNMTEQQFKKFLFGEASNGTYIGNKGFLDVAAEPAARKELTENLISDWQKLAANVMASISAGETFSDAWDSAIKAFEGATQLDRDNAEVFILNLAGASAITGENPAVQQKYLDSVDWNAVISSYRAGKAYVAQPSTTFNTTGTNLPPQDLKDIYGSLLNRFKMNYESAFNSLTETGKKNFVRYVEAYHPNEYKKYKMTLFKGY